jgi:2',3'-cyclic-nucleotide 2'-phosphodiesterase (5'-nucleotidase family)
MFFLRWLKTAVRRAPGVALAVLILDAAPGWAQEAAVTIVHVNDLSRVEERGNRGGIARVGALIARERAAGGTVIVTHGGNALSPSLLSSFDQGAHMIDLLNRIGIDVMAVGNHEFDFGAAVLEERAREARFPLLTANAKRPDGAPLPGTTPTWMTTVGDFRLGFFGLTREDTAQISHAGPVLFVPPLTVAKRTAEGLREAGADMVVALASLSRAEGDALVKSGLVDLVLGSSDEILRTSYDGRTAFAASAQQANYVTIVDLRFERQELELVGKPVFDAAGELLIEDLAPTIETRFVWAPRFRTVDTAEIEPDPALIDVVQRHLGQLSSNLNERITVTPIDLDTRAAALLSGDTAFGNLVTDAMRAGTGESFREMCRYPSSRKGRGEFPCTTFREIRRVMRSRSYYSATPGTAPYWVAQLQGVPMGVGVASGQKLSSVSQ